MDRYCKAVVLDPVSEHCKGNSSSQVVVVSVGWVMVPLYTIFVSSLKKILSYGTSLQQIDVTEEYFTS